MNHTNAAARNSPTRAARWRRVAAVFAAELASGITRDNFSNRRERSSATSRRSRVVGEGYAFRVEMNQRHGIPFPYCIRLALTPPAPQGRLESRSARETFAPASSKSSQATLLIRL